MCNVMIRCSEGTENMTIVEFLVLGHKWGERKEPSFNSLLPSPIPKIAMPSCANY